MDALLKLLHEKAAALDDYTTPQDASWGIDVTSSAARVAARTKALFRVPEEAWEAAKELRDDIIALGYTLHGDCHVGIASEIGTEPPGSPGWTLPIVGWRGRISLVVQLD